MNVEPSGEKVLTRHPLGINTNTFISVGLLITLLTGFVVVISAVYSARYELSRKQDLFELNQNLIIKRLDKFESTHESWGYQDMYIWAGRFQRDNPQLKVPEPKSQ